MPLPRGRTPADLTNSLSCFPSELSAIQNPKLEIRNVAAGIGATDWDRTSNLRLRRPTLYPIELQSQGFIGLFENFELTLSFLRSYLQTYQQIMPRSLAC